MKLNLDAIIKRAKPGERTLFDQINEVFPQCVEEEADTILLDLTPFPLGPIQESLERLQAAYREAGEPDDFGVFLQEQVAQAEEQMLLAARSWEADT